MDPISLEKVKEVLSALKDAARIAKSLMSAFGSSKHKAETSDLYGKLTEAYKTMLGMYDSYETLAAEKRKLEEQMAQLKAWDEEKKDYKLAELVPGLWAYAYAPGGQLAQNTHWLCEKCYHDGKKSILQLQLQVSQPMASCARCRWQHPLGPGRMPQPRIVR